MTEYQKYPGRLDEENPDSFDAGSKGKNVLYEEVEVSPGVRKMLPTALGALLQELLDRTPVGQPALSPGENHIGEVGGRLAVASATFQRPGDANGYVAGDVVSNSVGVSTLMELEIARVNGGSGWLEKVRLVTNNKNTTARFRVWFYKIANPAVAADNARMTLLWANRENRLGYIDLPPMATEDATSDSASALASPGNSANLPFTFFAEPGTRKLYALLEALDAFAPVANQQFFLEVTASLN